MTTLHRGHRTVLYRGERIADHRPVLVKVLVSRQSRRRDVEALAHEYELGRAVAVPAIVRPLALSAHEGMPALVLEDPGGVLLETLVHAPMDPGRFLRLAVGLATALAEVHEQSVVHKDIQPENIFVDVDRGVVRIGGLGLATRVPRGQQAAGSPELIEGSLPYMSPEQTGRMNRAIDLRTDLYSLGVTFYEMLTGTRPFEAHDPLEWVHCHIARAPVAPAERVPGLPRVLSDVVMQLLAKVVEDRYQSARGLAEDLSRCLVQWEATRRIEPFPLRARDISDRFQLPQRLYGRQAEVAALLAAFERTVERGTPELVLVSGYSGIGKSTLVKELNKPVVRERGFFVAGKADQYRRNIPYSALVQALSELVLEILPQSEARLGQWRERLTAALGINAQLIVDVVPQLEWVIGPQVPVPELPRSEAQNRFDMVFRSFLGVFTRKEHPVVLFLDDLQWADSASLRLLEHVVTHPDTRYLLTIGAYRDNEVGPSHPLTWTLDEVRKAGGVVHQITLAPLSATHFSQLVVDTLHCSREDAKALADLLHAKTAGNPFFANQFLTTLHQDGLIQFDPRAQAWRWEVQQIATRGYTDNVVELMVAKLNRFPATTRDALMLAACVGNTAEVRTMAVVHKQTEEHIHQALWTALQEGLVLRQGDTYRFLHDRVQQAAYSLIPDAARREVHLTIARLLLADTPAEKLEERIFEIVNHFNLGAAALSDGAEKAVLAELNLRAGRKAKGSAAYGGAARYVSAGMALLEPGDWDARYGLAYALHLERAECEFLNGNFDEAERLFPVLLAHARGDVDRAAAYGVRIDAETTKGQMHQAVASTLECLQVFGIEMSPHPTWKDVEKEYRRVWENLGDRPIESLRDLPLMTDPHVGAAMRALSKLFAPAFLFDNNLLYLHLCHMVNLSLRHGNTDASGFGYAWFGLILGAAFHRYDDGYRFAQVGHDVVEKHGFVAYRARLDYSLELVSIWTRPLPVALGFIRTAFREAAETGDLTVACYCCNHTAALLLAQGAPLDDVYRETERGLEFTAKAKFQDVYDSIVHIQRLVRNMQGRTAHFSTFGGDGFDEAAAEASLAGSVYLTNVCWYYILKLAARFMSGDVEQAVAAGARAHALIWASRGHIQIQDFYFFHALALAADFGRRPPAEQKARLRTLGEHREQLREWAENCPETFLHRHALVCAELARLTGQELEAERLYEQAIRSARENGFTQNEAIANELAARFHLGRGLETMGTAYLREARACYLRWGAHAKVADLDRRHPRLIESPSNGTTFQARADQLDLLSVIKASQTISSEIVLAKLGQRLIQVVMEEGGAQKGCLLLARAGALRVEVEARLGPRGIETSSVPSEPAESFSGVPGSIINYVWRTREAVVLVDASDAAGVGRFASDPYLATARPKSVLCLPIVRQAEPVGLLYLENNLVVGAFTRERLAVLEVLAAQAAISLENATLVHSEHEARAAAEQAEQRADFLAEASVLLSESLELDEVLSRLARLCVRSLASWCVIDVIEGGVIRRLAGAHADPEKEHILDQLRQRFPPYRDSPQPGATVMRTSAPLLAPDLTDEQIRGYCWTDEHAALIRALGTRTALAVPLLIRGRPIGSLTMGAAAPRRRYGQADLELAQELARRAAISVENAQILREWREAVRVRDEFLDVVSHELRTPLTPLDLQLRTLQKVLGGRQQGELAQQLEVSLRQVARLMALVEDLLDVARIRGGHLTLERQPVDLVEVVRRVAEDYRGALERSCCTLELKAEGSIVGHWDKRRVEQVVVALLSNAMKYGVNRPIVITATADGARARLSVRDFGVGIAPEQQARIFERFARAVSASHFGGLGLGLYIAHEIVEAHHGSIRVDSEPGAGATFIVDLPLEPPEESRDAAPLAAEQPRGP